MKCYCGGTAEHTNLSEYALSAKGKRVVFRDIPAEVCQKCGETYFTKEVSVMMDTLIKSKDSEIIDYPSPKPISSEEIKKIREDLDLSQTKLALLIGVTPSTIALWEQGRRTPIGPARVLLRMLDNIHRKKRRHRNLETCV